MASITHNFSVAELENVVKYGEPVHLGGLNTVTLRAAVRVLANAGLVNVEARDISNMSKDLAKRTIRLAFEGRPAPEVPEPVELEVEAEEAPEAPKAPQEVVVHGNGLEATLLQGLLPYIQTTIDQNVQKQTGDIQALVKQFVNEVAPREIVIQDKIKDIEYKLPQMVHKSVPKLIAIAEARKIHGKAVHCQLVGPAGTGKTHAVHQVADACGLDYYPTSVGPQTSKTDLLGFKDAHGNYNESLVYKAVKHGGILLLDEFDSANAGVVTILNSILANDVASFPNGEVVEVHKDFVCFIACNTFGRGGDRQYVGRNQLDLASLDRFVVVEFDLDEALETALVTGVAPNRQLKTFQPRQVSEAEIGQLLADYRRWRKRAEESSERVHIGQRSIIFGVILLKAGFERDEIDEMAVWKGVSKDIRSRIAA